MDYNINKGKFELERESKDAERRGENGEGRKGRTEHDGVGREGRGENGEGRKGRTEHDGVGRKGRGEYRENEDEGRRGRISNNEESSKKVDLSENKIKEIVQRQVCIL